MEKMASLGKLSATVAHELNNPLSGILTYTRLIQKKLKENKLSAEDLASTQESLSIISEETTRCGNIVKNLLLFSKRQIGEFAVEDLHSILDRCVQLVQHHLQLNNIKLVKEYRSKPAEVMCDKNQIQQAVLAILVNAVEAMPEGGTLTLRTKSDDESVLIEIHDTGAGISPIDLPHIFEPFYSTKKEGKGVGLGLSVAYGIIERHDGEIDVKTAVGKGSTFIIKLPLLHPEKNVSESPTSEIKIDKGEDNESRQEK
ncbi:MAG: ATP-binding protein, partial [candidate division Zixibacteria bacterium]|nr:ATP-binding protein [candidate division Zixibacteria bacterium]